MEKEEMLDFLKNLNIDAKFIKEDKNGFTRTIQFKVYHIVYNIVWFCNESTLRIGVGDRPACIPFKYMYYDTTYPLIDGNRSIGFSYIKNECKNMFDREYPYEVLRIPLEPPKEGE